MSNKLSMGEIVAVLNSCDFAAIPRLREDGTPTVMVTATDADGKRYFLNKLASVEINPDGTAKYIWARGKEMAPKAEAAA